RVGTTASSHRNTILFTGAGTTAICTTGNSANSFYLGDLGSSNVVTISNGARLDMPKGNGGQSVDIGRQSGANYNALIVTGSGSAFNGNLGGGASSPMSVGAGGSFNTLTVSAGAYCAAQRVAVGSAGNDNFALVTGAGSLLTFNGSFGNNPVFEIGTQSGASRNRLTIENGAAAYFQLNGRSAGIGLSNGANSNAVLVTGLGSSFTFIHSALPLTVGFGDATPGNNSNGNHIDIFGGSVAVLKTTVFMKGTNTAINLGDATITSTAIVDRVTLSVPDALLNINHGKLIAGDAGTMVSGPGNIMLVGPAEVSTTNVISSLDSVIAGMGDLTKSGPGTLVLSATNTYSGATIVSNGVLRLTHPDCLSVNTDARITTGAMIDLAFTGINTIKGLYIDGVQQPAGLYGQSRLPSYLSGTGSLRVLSGQVSNNILFVIR
ncbi:MAG: autotransporter-associated beta strand repeat-containing protein, partial [Verrucomicrobia bacterium]|nr:autotransporter-associated beta strand repeat-containing protein [Verrucomicrobiota bacterium]